MKVSEVTVQDLVDNANENPEDAKVIKDFKIILPAVKSFIKSYTGLDDSQMDAKEDLTQVLFVISNEMYENGSLTVDGDKVNKLVMTILNMHSMNYL
ncbi:phage gp6-like head-tail connector protein [Fictibacillus enclensis]|uniref:phage gp6-like head-tail connector protein n=1 Tax=Fictibacillus enclensis TaxID=1017270 RepID=UPI0025A02D63|nr:phage gp6-like head-tail connector protein [Fictibacillus enclensis]MDM5199251.1 phage gp6-like head-tail connector protein [Fictibacillus enclensis]